MASIPASKKIVLALMAVPLAVSTAYSGDGTRAAGPASAKSCLGCHKPEPNTLQGYFDGVAFKARTIQMKIDDSVELVRFDEDEIKVVNGDGKTGDGDFLKNNRVRKGHEIIVQYSEKEGVKTAVKLVEKPPVKLPPEMLVATDELEKLVAQGPEKGKYFLFDSRPVSRFREGAIPTAVSMPYPAFDSLINLLPPDKGSRIIFYCGGPSCTMSPGSAAKAKKLGYTNVRVYRDGMPAWSEKHFGVLSAQSLKAAWVDADFPHLLLDVRSGRETARGFIRGAVSFPANRADKLIKELPPTKKNPQIIVYDGRDGSQAAKVAGLLIKAGYTKVMVLTGGFDAWRTAQFEVARGRLNAKATYTPKPRPGEINVAEFRKYAANPPASVMIIDVRNPDEANAGMLKNARLIPVEEIRSRTAEIPKDKQIITHCATGVRAEMAYHTLRGLGYVNVRFLNAKMDIKKNGSYSLTVE